MKKYIIFLMLLIVSSFSLVQAETFGYGRTETIPINYSLIPTVNNSQYFDGYSISTLYTYYKSLFDDVYCELTGCTMTGDIDMDGNDITNAGDITADNFIGDGSQLTDVWLTSTAQTGLTGDKTGSFDLETTGTAEFGDTTLNGTLVTENTVWDKYGATSIGSNMILQFLSDTAPVNGVGLKMTQSFDAADSTGIGIFVQHKPTVQRDGTHTAIRGYNIVEGENFTGTNKIAALNFGNFQYFSGLGCTSITSGSVLTDVLAVDVFGANAIESVKFLAKDIYGVRAIPVISATCTDAYGYYYKASTGGTISGTEYGINLEEPTEGATYNRQAVLEGDGTGSGIWFDGKLGQRISSCNDRLCVKNVATDRPIDRTSDVAVATVTVANTTTETLLWTGAMAANSLLAGNLFKFHCDGIISNGDSAVATDQVTLRIKVGGSTVATLNPALKKIPVGSHWHIDANATQRTIGAAGPRAVHIDMDIAGATTTVVAIANINTTNNMDVTITAEWASAAAANTISLYQGFMEYKN